MKKQTIKKTIGWILVVIQCMSIFGRIMSGTSFPSGIPGFFNFLGFSIFGIIGAILLISAYKKKS